MVSFASNLQMLLEKAMPDAQEDQQHAVLRAHLETLLPQHFKYTVHVTKTWDELVSLLRRLEGSEQPSTSQTPLIKTEQSDLNWLSNARLGGPNNDSRPNNNNRSSNGSSRRSNNRRRYNQSGRNNDRPHQDKRSPRRDGNREKCSYCHKPNHSYDVCRTRLRHDEERRERPPKDSSYLRTQYWATIFSPFTPPISTMRRRLSAYQANR